LFFSVRLTGGRAILKLVDKAVEELSVQANVSAPLSRPAASIEEVASNIPQAESIKPRLINLTPMETDNATQKDCDSEVQELDAVSETSAAISQHSITAQSCGETYPSSTRDEDSMHINEEDDSNSIIVPERIALVSILQRLDMKLRLDILLDTFETFLILIARFEKKMKLHNM